jgi:hypothetical protein
MVGSKAGNLPKVVGCFLQEDAEALSEEAQHLVHLSFRSGTPAQWEPTFALFHSVLGDTSQKQSTISLDP